MTTPPPAGASLRPSPPTNTEGRGLGIIATLFLVGGLVPLALLSPWVLSAALILGCGVFVAFEFALVKMPTRELEREAEAGSSAAAELLGMKRDLNAMLAACQFGITLTSLGLTLALEPALHHVLEPYARLANFSAALAMGIGAFLHVTFGELIPKGLALVVPRRVLHFSSPFMRMFRVLAVPFIKTCNAIANLAVHTLTGKHPDTDSHHEASIEIDEALDNAKDEGQIKPEQFELMQNVLAFADRTAREVMTPARLVVVLDLKRSWEDNFKIAEEHGFSRFPVIDGSPHNVVGYVRRAELLRAELQSKRDLKALLHPIERRPETASLSLLNLFKGTPMIAVYDEHDTFTGLLTAEDIIEQIVGEIYDDTDEPATSTVETQSDGSIRMNGSVLLEIAVQAIDFTELDEHEDVDTIGGLVLKKLGRQPERGDEVQIGRFRARVEATQGFRILLVSFIPMTEEELTGEPSAAS